MAIPHLNVPSLSVPKINVPKLTVPRLDVPGTTYKLYRNEATKDNKRYVTDVGDLLFGETISGTKQLRNTLDKAELSEFKYVPILNRILGLGVMLDERTIKPLFKGDFKTVGINALETAGNTFDTFANPVKSLIPWAGGGSWTDLLKSFGWEEGEYREQYQWNTGNFFVDLLGEMFSDPLNLLEMGSDIADKTGKAALAAMQDEVAEVVIKEAGESTAKQIRREVTDKLTIELAKSSADDATRLIEDFINTLDASKKELAERLTRLDPHSEVYKLTKEAVESGALTPKQMQSLSKSLTDLQLSKRFQIYKTWRRIGDTAKGIDNALQEVASVLSPVYGAGKLALQKYIIPEFRSQWKHLVKHLKDIDPVLAKQTRISYEGQHILHNNYAMYKPVYGTFSEILSEYNLSQEKLVQQFIKMYQSVDPLTVDINTLKQELTEYLYTKMPKLKQYSLPATLEKGMTNLVDETVKLAQATGKVYTQEQIEALVNAVSDAGVLMTAAKEIHRRDLVNQTIAELDSLWARKDVNGEYAAITKLRYIDETIKQFDPKKDLRNLKSYLAELKAKDEQQYIRNLTIFNYLGVTVYNAKEVAMLLEMVKANPKDTKTLNKLKGVLIRGKTGFLNQVDEMNVDLKTIENYGKQIIKNNTLDIFKNPEKTNEYLRNINNASINRTKVEKVLPLSVESGIHEFYDLNTMLWNNFNKNIPNFRNLEANALLEFRASDVNEFLNRLSDIPGLSNVSKFNSVRDLFTSPIDLKLKSESFSRMSTKELDDYAKMYHEARQWIKENATVIRDYYIGHANEPLWPAFNSYIDVLMDEQNMTTVAKIKDLINTSDDLFINKLANAGQFDLMNQIIATSNIDKNIYDALSQPDSTLRQNLKRAASLLKDSELMDSYVARMNTVLATIDNTNNINKLLNYLPIVRLIDDVDYANYTRGLLYNIIYENKQNYAVYMSEQNRIIELTNRFMDQIKMDKPQYFDIPGFEDSLRENVTNGFKQYTTNLIRIGNDNNISMLFGQHLGEKYYSDIVGYRVNAAKDLDLLGLNYAEVAFALIEQKADPIVIVDTVNAIRSLGNYITRDEYIAVRQNILKYIKTSKQPKEVLQYAQTQLNKMITETLSDALIETYSKISYYNTILVGGNSKNLGKYWSEHGAKQVENYLAIMNASELDTFVRAVDIDMNRYSASTQNGVLSFKKVYRPSFAKAHKITTEYLSETITDIDYARLYQQYEHLYEVIENTSVYDPGSIDYLRNCLIDCYENANVSFAPKAPRYYFRDLDDYDILVWDSLTKSKSMNARLGNDYAIIKERGTIKYNYTDKATYRANALSKYETIEEVVHKKGITDAAILFNDMLDELPVNEKYNAIDKPILDQLHKYIKDPESFGRYYDDIDNYQRNNVRAYNNLKPLDAFIIEPDNYNVDLRGESLNSIGRELKLPKDRFDNYTGDIATELKDYGLSPTMDIRNEKVRVHMSVERSKGLNSSLMNWNAKQLRSFIDNNNKGLGFLIYQVPVKTPDDAPHLGTLHTPKDLQEAGLVMTKLERETGTYYIFRRTDNTIHPVNYTYMYPRTLFPNQQNIINKILESNTNLTYKASGQDLPYQLYTGVNLEEDIVETILQDKDLVKILGDAEIRKAYSIYDKSGINSFWSDKILKANTVFVGDPDCYNNWMYEASQLFEGSTKKPKYSSHVIDRDIWVSSIAGIERSNVEQRLLQTFLNKDFSLQGPLLTDVFKNSTDEEINNFFKQTNFVPVLVKQNRNGEPHIYKIQIRNKKEYNIARDAGALVLSSEMYRTAVLGINRHKIDNKFMQIYNRSIVGTYKSIYIGTVGTLFRNGLDSMVYKNAASSQGFSAIIDNFKYSYKGMKLLEWYDGIQRKIRDYSLKELGVNRISRRGTQAVLDELTKEDRDLYILLDMYMKSSASSSYSKTVKEILLENNMSDTVLQEDTIIRWYNELVFEKSPLALVNNVNDLIEQSARIGLFLNAIDNGLKPNDAISLIAKTHFDYELDSVRLKPIEQVFWFAVFPINNILYYLNEGLTKNPNMLKLQFDALELSYNDDDYSWEDVRNSDFLSYHALVGNIRFELFGKQIILKTGSSVMDFFTWLLNPFSEAKDRINPFLAILLGLEPLSELNPFSSYGNKLEQIKLGRSYIPSLYSIIYPKYEYTPKYYRRYNYTKSRWLPKPRKVYSNVPNANYMRYKFTTNRYNYSTGKNYNLWLDRTTSIEPHWYMNNYKLFRANGKYGRAVRKLKMPKKFKLSVSK